MSFTTVLNLVFIEKYFLNLQVIKTHSYESIYYLILGCILVYSNLSLKSQNFVNTRKYSMFEKDLEKQKVQKNESSFIQSKIFNDSKINKVSKNKINQKKIASISATRFSSSMNIYGLLNSQQKALQYNSDVDMITFFHRKSPFFTTNPVNNSASIVVSWSLNHGLIWDSTCI